MAAETARCPVLRSFCGVLCGLPCFICFLWMAVDTCPAMPRSTFCRSECCKRLAGRAFLAEWLLFGSDDALNGGEGCASQVSNKGAIDHIIEPFKTLPSQPTCETSDSFKTLLADAGFTACFWLKYGWRASQPPAHSRQGRIIIDGNGARSDTHPIARPPERHGDMIQIRPKLFSAVFSACTARRNKLLWVAVLGS